MRLVLFDVDGTLLLSDGAGRSAMEGALRTVFGSTGDPAYRYDGKTDRQIVRDLMRLDGHDDGHIDERMERLLASYLGGLRRELSSGEQRTHRLEGVTELLDALEQRDDVVLGLLTGNLAEGATMKLEAAGIDPARFKVSAFGSDHELRPELPAIAQRRACELLGVEIRGERVVVVGDTPADIECGRTIGARAIAVATGRYDVTELARHNPMAVFPDLRDTKAVLECIVTA